MKRLCLILGILALVVAAAFLVIGGNEAAIYSAVGGAVLVVLSLVLKRS